MCSAIAGQEPVAEHSTTRCATTPSKLRVQFLGLGYYYPSTDKIDWSTQFGAVGYIITLYSSKSYAKSCGVRPEFWGSGPSDPPVNAPMDTTALSNTVQLSAVLVYPVNDLAAARWRGGCEVLNTVIFKWHRWLCTKYIEELVSRTVWMAVFSCRTRLIIASVCL